MIVGIKMVHGQEVGNNCFSPNFRPLNFTIQITVGRSGWVLKSDAGCYFELIDGPELFLQGGWLNYNRGGG